MYTRGRWRPAVGGGGAPPALPPVSAGKTLRGECPYGLYHSRVAQSARRAPLTSSQVQDLPMPIVSDLDAAMMQPARSVPAVRRLGGGLIRMNDAGRPLRAVGRDAVVYELRTPSGRILVLRCFLRPDAHRDRALAQRYEALRGDPHLGHLRGAERRSAARHPVDRRRGRLRGTGSAADDGSAGGDGACTGTHADRRPSTGFAARDRSNRWRSWPMSGWRPRRRWRRPASFTGISPPTISSCVPMARSRWSISIRRRGHRSRAPRPRRRATPRMPTRAALRWTLPGGTGFRR